MDGWMKSVFLSISLANPLFVPSFVESIVPSFVILICNDKIQQLLISVCAVLVLHARVSF